MKFIKQVSLYTLVGFFGAAVNFFLMPVLSHYLSPADYGLLSLLNTYVTILIPLVSLVAYSLLNIEFFKEKDKKVFASKFASIHIIPVFSTLFLSLLVWLFYGRFADDLELAGTGIQWGYIILFITFFSIYIDYFLNYLILQKKAISYSLYTIGKVCLEVGLTIYLVIIKGWSWEGRMYSWLLTSAVFFLLTLLYFHKQGFLSGRVRFQYMREGIVFGSPLILHVIGKFVVNQSDRLFIIKMVSLEEAGIYNIGYTVGFMVMVVINAFFSYYSPFLMERLANITEEKKLQLVKMGYIYGAGCLLLLGGVTIFAPLLFRYFIDPRYDKGVYYAFWVALGYCFWGGYMLFTGFFSFYRRNRILGWLSIFNILSNLLLNYFFIRIFGAIGAAYATALSFFFIFVLVAFQANRLLPLPWLQYQRWKAAKLT